MSDPVRFLGAFGQTLSTMTLYADGHPMRHRAAYEALQDLQSDTRPAEFTFLGDETIYDREPLKLRSWEWSVRLANAGIQRLEFKDRVSPDEFEGFLEEILARLTLSTIDTSEARQMRATNIKYGAVGVRGSTELKNQPQLLTADLSFSLGEETDTFRWLQAQAVSGDVIPMAEAEAVVRSLALAMHGGQHTMLPLLQLKEFDQYTTSHSLNVAVLSMGFAKFLELDPSTIRALGLAGLLHDLGKIRIPIEVLTKPGKLSPEERALMNQHPIEGARLILRTGDRLELAAVVAYEHHIMMNGGGYPPMRFQRCCHHASKLVHLCDVYDALRTRRPYRDAWPAEKVLAYLEERAGVEFDPELVASFVRMMRKWDQQVAVLTDEHAPVPAAPRDEAEAQVATLTDEQPRVPAAPQDEPEAAHAQSLVSVAAPPSRGGKTRARSRGKRRAAKETSHPRRPARG